ncbi:hypothetical protein [Paraburkholderia sp. MM6662-R1]|uniref:hypothetical protein n=1 Tax=Paraburkholderia sp. MM6662-R1 TaxID=2991066 RepID=UPI003D24EB28
MTFVCARQSLFAPPPIAAGERLVEHKGEGATWRHAAARHRSEVGHTFGIALSDGCFIDGSLGGNSA